MTVADVVVRYLRYRALCENRKGRPHVATSELYVANMIEVEGHNDGQTMKRAQRKPWARRLDDNKT